MQGDYRSWQRQQSYRTASFDITNLSYTGGVQRSAGAASTPDWSKVVGEVRTRVFSIISGQPTIPVSTATVIAIVD